MALTRDQISKGWRSTPIAGPDGMITGYREEKGRGSPFVTGPTPYVLGGLGAAVAAPAVVGALAAGGGAAAATIPQVVAPVAKASGLPWAQIIPAAAGIFTQGMGGRAQSKANREAAASADRSTTAQLDWAREQARTAETANARREELEAKRWASEQTNTQRKWDSDQEQRSWDRRIYEEDRFNKAEEKRLDKEERERRRGEDAAYADSARGAAAAAQAAEDARLAPYKQARLAAMANLGQMLGLGGAAPGAGQVPPQQAARASSAAMAGDGRGGALQSLGSMLGMSGGQAPAVDPNSPIQLAPGADGVWRPATANPNGVNLGQMLQLRGGMYGR